MESDWKYHVCVVIYLLVAGTNIEAMLLQTICYCIV